MTHGILIKDARGNTVMGPDTFTVRMVDSRLSGVGMMSPGQAVYLPMSSKVRSGMFAIVMPLRQYPQGNSLNDRTWSLSPPVSLPYVTVHDGYIYLRANGTAEGRTDGNVAIYIFTNI